MTPENTATAMRLEIIEDAGAATAGKRGNVYFSVNEMGGRVTRCQNLVPTRGWQRRSREFSK
jgi:hypothetical protein